MSMFEDPEGEAYRALMDWRKSQPREDAYFLIKDWRGLRQVWVTLVPDGSIGLSFATVTGFGETLEASVNDALRLFRVKSEKEGMKA